MEITDEGYLLSLRRFGENSAIATVCTARHGIMRGMVRGAAGKRQRGALQTGNFMAVQWRARLNDQLGQCTLELLAAHAAHIMPDAQALATLNAACGLLDAYLVEREPHPRLYNLFAMLVRDLARGEAHALAHYAEHALAHYAEMELQLLVDCGFGLDLGECALTGTTEGLAYVSPKSGRAVCAEAALPYAPKLLPLPTFLTVENAPVPSPADITAALRLTGHFLYHRLAEAADRPVPVARARLLAMLEAKAVQAS